jgi:uncharacterized membrane protein YkoI
MKKSIILPACFTMLLACNEKKIAASEVPPAVISAFNAKYPGATDVKWEHEKEKGKWVYEAEFKSNGKEDEVHFDSAGNFVGEE